MRRKRFIRWSCGVGCCTFHAAATTTGACADRAGARVKITACRSRYVRSTKPVARPAAHRAFMRICGLTGSIAADTAWPNADQRHTGQARAQIQDHYRLRTSVSGGRESPRPTVHRRRAQSALGVGHHLAENRRRLAVSGRGARVVFTGSGGARAMAKRMTRQLTGEALRMALWRRGKVEGLLPHSDRGSQ